MNPLHPVGAMYESTGSCLFTVWSPSATTVDLVIAQDSAVIHPMFRDEMGYWTCSLQNISIETNYFFQLNGNKRLPDPASRAQKNGVHGPSSVIDRGFSWSDEIWTGLSMKDMILYEIHVGTFSPEGTFEGVIKKLDYLHELGITALELMPVSQFPGDRNWGYDGVYPFAVQHSYGGPMWLKKLVNEAHRRGIAVVLDVVYNHQGPEGNYLESYGPYFTKKYHTGWGDAINFDDAWCDGVRNFYLQNAITWLEEFHIDGLRLDAVHAIWDSGAQHFIEVLSKQVKALEQKTGHKRVLIAEFDLNNPRYINPYSKGGYGLDGQWMDEFHHALHALVTGETNGYYEDFGSIHHLLKSFKDSYVYTGQYSKHRQKYFGKNPEGNPYHQFVTFAQNHDQVGNRMLGDRLTASLTFESLKLVAAIVLLSPHVPLLFMGEEYGEKNPFQYFVSHTDEKLVELVREGRKKEFSYFKWKREVPDPQDTQTFMASKLSWAYQEPPHNLLFELYKFLIAFRKERIAMQGYERHHVVTFDLPGRNLIAMERRYESDALLILFNLDLQPATFSYPGLKPTMKIFDSSSAPFLLQDSGVPAPVASDAGTVVINPHAAVIFEL